MFAISDQTLRFADVLVIPIRLVPRFVDLQSDEVADLFQTARHVQRGMELLHQVTSSTLTIQDGPDAGQTINHVHVHILPRRPGDFNRNDDIYHQLERHDQGPDVQWREEHDMEQEARQLREFFSTLS
jgi:diadenosine tetraphosphate (Ap4A) HIT family hydrolase